MTQKDSNSAPKDDRYAISIDNGGKGQIQVCQNSQQPKSPFMTHSDTRKTYSLSPSLELKWLPGFSPIVWPWYRVRQLPKCDCFPRIICNECDMAAGNAYLSRHTVPVFFFTYKCSIVDNSLPKLPVIFPSFHFEYTAVISRYFAKHNKDIKPEEEERRKKKRLASLSNNEKGHLTSFIYGVYRGLEQMG